MRALIRSAVLIVVAVPLALGGPLAFAADESSKSPKAILQDMARDLGKVRSYHVDGVQRTASGQTRITADVTASGRASVVIRTGGGALRLLAVPSATYLKANAAYWKQAGGSNGAALAQRLANRWVKVPAAQKGTFDDLFADLTPKRMAACTQVGTGTVVKGGTATIDGHKAVVLIDRGEKPGTSPGKLYVTTSGSILPLRSQQTGRQKAGGHLDKDCQERDTETTSADLRFSRFNRKLTIVAPKNAISAPSDSSGTQA
jgi:hypothetical protein